MNNTKLLVGLGRNDIYRQLLAMCEDSRIFSVRVFPGGYEEKDLELLTVADRVAVTEKPDVHLRNKIIGYIRLMHHNGGTLIIFRQENHPLWHDIPVCNPALWDSFVRAVFENFEHITISELTPQNESTDVSININIQGNVEGDMIVGDDNSIKH